VVVTASDGTYSSSVELAWTLSPSVAPAAPSLSNPGFQSNQAGDEVNLQVEASDAAGYGLTFSATNLPDGLSINPSLGMISGTVADDAVSGVPAPVTLGVTDGVGESTSVTLLWAINPSPLTLTLNSLSLTAGVDSGVVTLGTFTTPDQNSDQSQFTALVNWADGNTDDATVTGEGNGTFTITDDHLYGAAGSYAVSVLLTKDDGSVTEATETLTLTTQQVDGGFQQGVVVGDTSGLLVAVLHTTDADAGSFSATVTPGDGSGSVTGTLESLGGGEYGVYLSHNYSAHGAYTATVVVTGPGSVETTVTSTVEVGDIYAGENGTLTVAQFALGNASATASSYPATINWGDGNSSTGTVTVSGGLLTVTGAHTFTVDSIDASNSAYPVSVTINGPGGQVLTASKQVEVTRPPIQLQMANVTEG
jgi:hypothetical protein